MLSILDYLVVFLGLIWTILCIREMSRGRFDTLTVILAVFQITCALPVLLDHLIGPPEYHSQPGFAMAADDPTTRAIYALYIIFIPFVWWPLRKARIINTSASQPSSASRSFLPKKVLYISAALPVLGLYFAPIPSIYLTYAAAVRHSLEGGQDFHSYMSMLCNISIFAIAAILIQTNRNLLLTAIFWTPMLITSLWIHGKRSIVATAMLLVVSVLWHKGLLRKGRIVLFGVSAFALLAAFSTYYQSSFREHSSVSAGLSSRDYYENVRIDYGRDDKIKMTIFAFLHPERMQILEHAGQSTLFYLTFFIPRDAWSSKPLPYAQYFTSAMLGRAPQMWGWGMTTSWLEEAIANFGLMGFLLGPLLFVGICRLGDSTEDVLVKLMTTYVGIMFLTLHLVAFFIPFSIWMLLVFRAYKGRRAHRRQSKQIISSRHSVSA
jgi:hypothetical protein